MTIGFGALIAIIVGSAATGGLVTSFAEFKKEYNLWDLLNDKYQALKAKVLAAFAAVKRFLHIG